MENRVSRSNGEQVSLSLSLSVEWLSIRRVVN